MVGSTVCKALGLPIVDNNIVYLQFISELNENSQSKDYLKMNYKNLKEVIRETAHIIEKLGYKKLVVFFDKIDEYTKLKSQIDSIVEFIEPITTDTSLIYSSELGFEFLLWNKLKEKMKEKQVRFDKSRPIDINWDKDEMKKMLSRRLSYFALHKSNVNVILGSEQQLDKIIEMANGSPRQLTMLLSRIYEEQSKINNSANAFSEEAVRLGMQNFSQTFEYELFFPGMSIKDVVNRILKVGKIKFSISDLASATKKSPQTASNWIRTMKNVGFVEEMEGDSGKTKIYKVTDPKIIYMIENKLNYVG